MLVLAHTKLGGSSHQALEGALQDAQISAKKGCTPSCPEVRPRARVDGNKQFPAADIMLQTLRAEAKASRKIEASLTSSYIKKSDPSARSEVQPFQNDTTPE